MHNVIGIFKQRTEVAFSIGKNKKEIATPRIFKQRTEVNHLTTDKDALSILKLKLGRIFKQRTEVKVENPSAQHDPYNGIFKQRTEVTLYPGTGFLDQIGKGNLQTKN